MSGVAAKPQTVRKTSGFVKGLITGSAAAVVICGAAAYGFVKDDINKRHKIKRAFEILKYGVPERPPPLFYYTNHVLSFDATKRTPIWVAEHLTKDSIEGDANRRRSKFRTDPSLGSEFSSSTDDYWNSGWSRGHMIPAANNKFSQEAMDETFYLTNIVPQDIENNTNFWNRLEIFCRDLAKKYSDIRIISGPLYRPQVSNKKKFVRYEVIGENNVAVPTHLYKIIVAEDKGIASKYLAAFVVPNEPIGSDKDLQDFQVPLETIEKELGIKFLKKLNRSYVEDLCKRDSCKLISKKELTRFYLTRKLEYARNVRRLDKVWQDIEMKEFKQDPTLVAMYKEKRAQLESEKAAAA